MWIFAFIPGLLFVVAGVIEGVQALHDRYRMNNPYMGHLNYRRNLTR